MDNKVLAWFSCGVASTIASKITLEKYDDVDVIYCDTGSEHPDNVRYLLEVEQWLGQKITTMKNEKYKDIWDVFEKDKWLVGIGGARCTLMLKKALRHRIEAHYGVQIFGYTVEEKHRADRLLEQNMDIKAEFPLIDAQLTKQDCFSLLAKTQIEIPEMYKLGYRNNNCIGCVKGGMGYWNKIRVDFPEVFDRMAKVERKLNVSIIRRTKKGETKRVFLDELPEDVGNYKTEPSISCGVMCEQIADKVFNNKKE